MFRNIFITFLVLFQLAALLNCMKRNDSSSSSSSVEDEDNSMTLDYDRPQPPHSTSPSSYSLSTTQMMMNNQQIIKSLLKKEMRKLKSTMTDSIMEEVINYYGKKLEMTDSLSKSLAETNRKLKAVDETLNTLNSNYKQLMRNHRNLVDTVRNNMPQTRTRINSNIKSSSSSAESSSTKKPSAIFATILTDLLLNGNNKTSDIEVMALRNHLIYDLETKYSGLINENILNFVIRNTTTTTAAAQNSTEMNAFAQYHKSSTSNDDDETKTQLKKMAKNDTMRKIVIRNDSKTSKRKHYNHNLRLKKHHNKQINTSNMMLDCEDVRQSKGANQNGVYKVFSVKLNTSFDVYCEFESNVGWTVVQKRFDGTVNFHQNWKTYKHGFGNLLNHGEFWLGLDFMNAFTSQNNYSLQIVMTDWQGAMYTAEYIIFKVNDERYKYRLDIGGYVKETSNAGDSLSGGGEESYRYANNVVSEGQTHNGMAFSTYDSDNDMRFYDNCAQLFKAGWWFNQCFQSNLNGIYYGNQTSVQQQQQLRFMRNGIHWNSIDFYKSLKSTKMRIRRRLRRS